MLNKIKNWIRIITKRDLTFDEYTLDVRYQDINKMYIARLNEFLGLAELGKTKKEAISKLKKVLDKRIEYLIKTNKKVPLPGYKPSIKDLEWAPTDKLKKIEKEAYSFVDTIFDNTRASIITDKSTLFDFLNSGKDVKTIGVIIKKVKRIYKIDMSSVKDKPIVEIVDYLIKKKPNIFKIV